VEVSTLVAFVYRIFAQVGLNVKFRLGLMAFDAAFVDARSDEDWAAFCVTSLIVSWFERWWVNID